MIKNCLILFLTISALLTLKSYGQSSDVNSAQLWCKALVNQKGGAVVPTYPLVSDLKPGQLLRLPIGSSKKSRLRQCVAPQNAVYQEAGLQINNTGVELLDFTGKATRNGDVNLGFSSIPKVPVDLALSAGTNLKDDLDIKFTDVERLGSNVPFSKFSVDEMVNNKRVPKLTNAIYDITNYRDDQNPEKRNKYNLFFLVVDNVYVAKGIEYKLHVNKGSSGNIDLAVIKLNAEAGGGFTKTNDYTISMKRKLDVPIVLGVTGLLLEVDSRTGKITNRFHIP